MTLHAELQLLIAHITPTKDGGGERDRTDDLLLAKQALSQLSYTPGSGRHFCHLPADHALDE